MHRITFHIDKVTTQNSNLRSLQSPTNKINTNKKPGRLLTPNCSHRHEHQSPNGGFVARLVVRRIPQPSTQRRIPERPSFFDLFWFLSCYLLNVCRTSDWWLNRRTGLLYIFPIARLSFTLHSFGPMVYGQTFIECHNTQKKLHHSHRFFFFIFFVGHQKFAKYEYHRKTKNICRWIRYVDNNNKQY